MNGIQTDAEPNPPCWKKIAFLRGGDEFAGWADRSSRFPNGLGMYSLVMGEGRELV